MSILDSLCGDGKPRRPLKLSEQGEITVDDLKAVGLQVREQKPNSPLNTDKESENEEGAIPPSAAIVAPNATPPEEDVPQSVLDATATSEEDAGVTALIDAMRRAHKKHTAVEKPDSNAPAEDTTHAESFDEMGAADYRKLMLEARSGKRS
jgi:hypothetical protein